MKRDKEQFKSKVREESYIKDKRPDIQLGRHTETDKKPVITQSKKNRMYQQRQEQTETAVNNQPFRADETTLSDTTENTSADETQQQTDEVQNFDFTDNNYSDKTDISKEDYRPPPETKGKYRKRMYHTHTEHKAADYDYFNSDNGENTDIPSDAPQNPDYDIYETVQEQKTEFTQNTDYNFAEEKAETDGNIPFDKVQTEKSITANKPKKQQSKSLSQVVGSLLFVTQ